MKVLIIAMLATFGLLTHSVAQNAQTDIDITSKYHINELVQKGKYFIWVTLANKSKYDYKDIVYKIQYIAGDGTAIGSKEYTYHDFVGSGITKKLKQQYLECPKDCQALVLSVVGGKKLE